MKNIVAFGAENKVSFSVLSDKGLYSDSPACDLGGIDGYGSYEKAVKDFLKTSGIKPDIIACDLHPDYRSTDLAERFHREYPESKIIRVQHHFSHIVSCMEDNDIDEDVIGVSFDGTGYGTDGNIWGGEFLVSSRRSFERKFHLEYIPCPGGDAAARDGWRMALAELYNVFGDTFDEEALPLIDRIGKEKVRVIKQMMIKEINCPLTSSAGRLFDAVSSLTGVCDVSSFEAEAAILLEKEADASVLDHYTFEVVQEEVKIGSMIRQILDDVNNNTSKGVISAKFHNTLSKIIYDVSERISEDLKLKKILLSGGCFQNKVLLDGVTKRFEGSGMELIKHNKYSPTDLGIAVGQAIIASEQEKCKS